jgi:hypothetical protein
MATRSKKSKVLGAIGHGLTTAGRAAGQTSSTTTTTQPTQAEVEQAENQAIFDDNTTGRYSDPQ